MHQGVDQLRISDCELRIEKIGVRLGEEGDARMIAGSCEWATAEIEQAVMGCTPMHLTSKA